MDSAQLDVQVGLSVPVLFFLFLFPPFGTITSGVKIERGSRARYTRSRTGRPGRPFFFSLLPVLQPHLGVAIGEQRWAKG